MNGLRRVRWVGILLLSAGLLLSAADARSRAPHVVRVGIYQNRPKVALSESGKPEGIFVDLIEAIADAEGWTIEYVPGTWAEGLDRLAKGEIHLMPDVAINEERQARYAFHSEPALSSWFQIYARRGGDVRSVTDLDGKRIALLEGSIQQAAFEKMVRDFDVATPLLTFADYDAAFAALLDGQADAVVANRFYDVAHLRNAEIEDTGIIFHPTRLYFAAPKTGNPALLAAIDRHLKRMKQDHASAYYRSFERWTAEKTEFRLPGWIRSAVWGAAAFLLLSLAWSFALQRQVAFRTRELQARKDETERLYESVREIQERFALFMLHSPIYVFIKEVTAAESRVLAASENYRDMVGIPGSEMAGKTMAELFPPDFAAKISADDWSVVSKGEVLKLEESLNGRRYHTIKFPLVQGGRTLLAGYTIDVTERREAEDRLRLHAQLLDSVREAVVASDLEGRILYWGRGAETMYGYSAEEVMGQPYRTFAGMNDPPNEEAFRRELLQKGSWSGEHLQKNRRGDLFWTATFISLVVDERGQPAGFVGIDQDVTERKRAEAALRESQARFVELFDANPTGLMLVERNTRGVAQVNPAAAAMIGLPAEQIVGRTCHGFMCPAETAACPVCDLHQTLDRSERILVKADGTRTPILKTVVPIALGGKDYLLESFIDIADRKAAEIERERLTRAIEQSGETIVITDADGTILYVNPVFEKITGYSREEALGRNPRILQSGVHEADFYRRMWETLRAGRIWEGEIVNRRKNGELFTEACSIAPVRDAEGRIVHFVAVKRDVTDRKQAEEERARLQSQLLHSQKLESVGRLAGGIAHDFNNILCAILGYAELMLADVAPDHRYHDDLVEIRKAAERAANLTRQLLGFARKQTIAPQVLDLNATVEGMLQMLRRLLGENVEIVWKPGPEAGTIRMDPSQLDQVLANLFINARDAIAGPGRIDIETDRVHFEETDRVRFPEARPGDYAMLLVRDTGCGMEPEVLDKIFEPFFTTKGLGKGTGLGLPTVYGIVQQNHGFIDVQSSPETGSTFRIHLPLHDARSS